MADAGGTEGGVRGALAVGRALRECREAYGRSLDDVAEATRIRRAYLDALEQGRYDEFPGEFWARLFLKSYAQHLGLPPDELLAEAFGAGPAPPPPRPAAWDRVVPADPPVSAATAPRSGEYRPRGRGRAVEERLRRGPEPLAQRGPRSTRRQWTSPLWGALAALVVAALLAGIVYNLVHSAAPAAVSATAGASGHRGATAKTGGQTGPTRAGAPTSTSPAAKTGHKGNGHATGTPSGSGYTTVAFDHAGAKATYRTARSTVVLHLVFQGPCWVGLTKGSSGTLVVNHVYTAGQALDVTATVPLHLTIGASWLASGTLDGQAIGPWLGGRVWALTIEP